ncbi:MAG: SDR family oxidoreductase [Rhodospirillaceae bacterium]|nr:SDR family oxidoreductase [Rhodospirillaceae bacterium]
MKVLVTGGSGFIGRALIPQLNMAGHDVIVSSRDEGMVLPGAVIRLVGELGPETDWSAALEDIEAVIHLAARVHVMNETATDPVAENRRINTEGTVRLARQAAVSGVKHFIFLSTIKVNGEATGDMPFHAADRPAPQDPYAIAKLEAEQALLGITDKSAMRADIIRPPLVYGPGVRGNFASLLGLCAKGLPLPLSSIDNRRSLIYVGNLVSLVGHILDHPKADGGIYLVRDGEDVSTPELIKRVSAALGITPRIFPFPQFLLAIAGALGGKSAAVSRLIESLVADDSLTRSDLDWTPPFSMVQGLQETADWFKNKR